MILIMRGLRQLAYGLLAVLLAVALADTMALVAPEERTAAAGLTSLARSIGASTSPIFSGLLL